MHMRKIRLALLTICAVFPHTCVAQPIADSLADRTTCFHANAAAKQAAHPSYALLNPAIGAPAANPGRTTVEFTRIEGKNAARVRIAPGTSLYGTGEVAGPLLRNGRKIVCWNTDAYGYDQSALSLYQSHPWVLAVRIDGSSFGALADTTYRCTVDTAATESDAILFVADGPEFPVIIIEKNSPQEVLKELARLTGRMPMPPKWALGYHQCRYSYYPESRVREIAREFRRRDIPCDVIWFDIDYMEAFRIFTFDRGYFPDPKKLNEDLLKQGFHNVWMIDPGLKSREERGKDDRKQSDLDKESPETRAARINEIAAFRALRESGTKADVWVKRSDGSNYEGEVWPGWCFFPDYTSPSVRSWWSDLYKDFMANGITGVWNDMNEPAVFNVASKTMPLDNLHAGDPSLVGPSGSPQGESAKGDHARYHNVYGMLMVKATREGIAAANPTKRPFVLSRANYIGGQRYAATWTGDNSATWAHMEESVPMVLNLGLSGQPFTGPDIGGFAGNGDGKLFARWMGVGALLPFARGHTGKENIDKEPWSFGPEVEKTCREALKRRYRLMPYLYTVFREAAETGLPVARPVFFADPKDPALRSEDDAFLLGDDILVVPQMVPDNSRVPVMPKGRWIEIEPSDDPDLPKLFIREGTIVPTCHATAFASQALGEIILLVALDESGEARGTLYEDEGDGFGYRDGKYLLTTLTAKRVDGKVTVTQDTIGTYKPVRILTKRVLGEEEEAAEEEPPVELAPDEK